MPERAGAVVEKVSFDDGEERHGHPRDELDGDLNERSGLIEEDEAENSGKVLRELLGASRQRRGVERHGASLSCQCRPPQMSKELLASRCAIGA